MIGRRVFLICAWIAGIFLALTAVSLGSLGVSALVTALHATGTERKANADTCTTLFGVAGIAFAGLLYLIRLVFQREFDSAIEFSVKITPIPEREGTFELLATLKNVTSIAAGIQFITYDIRDPQTEASVLPTNDVRAWQIPPPGNPPVLTRNTTWQLARLVSVLPKSVGNLHMLVAVCRIAMQPEEQDIRFEKLFPV